MATLDLSCAKSCRRFSVLRRCVACLPDRNCSQTVPPSRLLYISAFLSWSVQQQLAEVPLYAISFPENLLLLTGDSGYHYEERRQETTTAIRRTYPTSSDATAKVHVRQTADDKVRVDVTARDKTTVDKNG